MPNFTEETPPPALVQVRLSAPLHKEIKYEAVRLGISNTTMLDTIVSDYLSEHNNAPIAAVADGPIADLVYVRMSGEVHKPLKIQALLWGLSITNTIDAIVQLYMQTPQSKRRN